MTEQMTECRLIVDEPKDGVWNMAVDDHLLGWTSRDRRCCWRFYQWTEPTLSLGYFQKRSEREGHAASRACPVVRRASGGGAIVHDKELTYSLTVPADHPLGRRRQWTYEVVHTTLIDVLSEWGIQAGLYGMQGSGEQKSSSFLCFNRRSPGDVVVADVKVAGSAQRRGVDGILQHGSVLLLRSSAAPELAGLGDVQDKPIELDELAQAWQERLTDALGFRWAEDQLTAKETAEVQRIAEAKYGNPSWTEKRRADKPSL